MMVVVADALKLSVTLELFRSCVQLHCRAGCLTSDLWCLEDLLSDAQLKYAAVHTCSDLPAIHCTFVPCACTVSANGEPLAWERLLAATQEGDSRRTLTLPAGTHLVLVRSGDGKAASATQGLVSKGAAKDTERLLVATADMTLAVRVAMPHQQQLQQQLPRRRLDIAVLSISPYLCDVHGVLGQTYKRQYGVTPGPFTVEGAVFDYEVPSLRSDSFHFNRFRSRNGLGCGGDSGSSSGDSTSSNGSSGSGTSEAIEAMVVPNGAQGRQQMLRPMVEFDGIIH